jgi:hypothetical protein
MFAGAMFVLLQPISLLCALDKWIDTPLAAPQAHAWIMWEARYSRAREWTNPRHNTVIAPR